MSATVIIGTTPADSNGKAVSVRHKSAGVLEQIEAPVIDVEPSADFVLVQRCLTGDGDAWQEMYDRCQPRLLVTVRSLIAKSGRGEHLAEEITARVWLSLVAANGRLLDRFDAKRGGRLTTFLASLARHELLKYWRAEQRREHRERRALSNRPRSVAVGIDYSHIYWDEFLDTLTHREREFVENEMLAPSEDAPSQSESESFTRANAWQLRRRVVSKLRRFFGNGAIVD